MADQPRIGIAISTRNRREVLLACVEQWFRHTPASVPIIVVDDASDEPLDMMMVVRNERRLGIAMTKNRGIAALMAQDVDHLFLVDDDIHPVTDDWWKPYVDSPEPHLSYQWTGRTPWLPEHRDDQHWSIKFPRGVMLYADRKVIDTVGGMDPAHGAWGGEHVEWSHRIHTAGLTRWQFADVVDSDQLWYARDEHEGNQVNSTMPLDERIRLARANGIHWDKNVGDFVPYTERPGGHQPFDLGPKIGDKPTDVLDHVLALHPSGIALEFGVGEGHSLRRIARRMPVIGFDSFQGLPEKWRDGFDTGMFACEPPTVANASLVTGLFEDTLAVELHSARTAGLIHIDCDLYSSTKTVLEALHAERRHLTPGTYVVFDEYHGYPGADDAHEQRAWREFADDTDISWTVIGHGVEQWAIRIV